VVWVGLAAAAIFYFRRSADERAASEAFVKRFALDLRRPEEIGAMKLEPEPDLAASIAAHAALRDAAAPLPSAVGLDAREEEVAAARDLMLDASGKRPGWAYHRFLLGQLAYRAAGPVRDPAVSKAWETWATPLKLAAAAAPGSDDIWSALGGVYLENWRSLSATQRSEALPVLQRALLDSRFVSARFLILSETVGRDEAMGLLPEDPELLGAAADSFSSHGDLAAAAALLARRDTADRKARAAGLRRIEGRFRARDTGGLRTACVDWAQEHPVSELDDPAGRGQAARVLELWPGDRGGPWETDPRADFVRFFLDGRESAVPAETLSRTLDALSDVPDHLTARVKLRAGDAAGAQALADRPQNQGAPEWTEYYADLARYFLKQERSREARGALDLLSLATRDSCDALLARRAVAHALQDTAELAIVNQRLTGLRSSLRWQDQGSEGARVSICVDPEQADKLSLDLRLVPQGPAVVRYGWGAGRDGALFVQNESVVSVPLAGISGLRDLTVRSVAGAAVRASASFGANR
jgi:thioredoxin-like negative regulator of GroEL